MVNKRDTKLLQGINYEQFTTFSRLMFVFRSQQCKILNFNNFVCGLYGVFIALRPVISGEIS